MRRAPADGLLEGGAMIAPGLRQGQGLRETFYCDYCHEQGTTAGGGLWKTTSHAHATLYYLHSACLLPYKARHGLRSVEGRLPIVDSKRRKAIVGADTLRLISYA